MGVGDGEISFAIDRHTRGPTIVVYRGLPRTNEIAIGIEDLNPGSHVDDVNQIVLVDGQGARFLKAPVRDAQASPSALSSADGRFLLIAPRYTGQRNAKY